MKLPDTMRAVELRAFDADTATGMGAALVPVEKPVPRPRPGEVLVRVTAAPINPGDLMSLCGRYGVNKRLPVVPGWIGMGTVVASGGGWLARALEGRRVVCCAADDRDGSWAEYMVAPAGRSVPLLPAIGDEEGANALVNPATAAGLLDRARRGRHRAVVQTAAAGSVGRMVLRLARRRRLPVINVVRRPEQRALLRAEGAEHVLDSEAPDFDAHLRALSAHLKATIAFDAVGGAMTGRLLAALPDGSRVTVYGALSGEDCRIDPNDPLFGSKTVDGFWLAPWLNNQNLLSRWRTTRSLQSLLAGDLKTEVRARLPLDEVRRALEMYAREMTRGKILLIPNGRA